MPKYSKEELLAIRKYQEENAQRQEDSSSSSSESDSDEDTPTDPSSPSPSTLAAMGDSDSEDEQPHHPSNSMRVPKSKKVKRKVQEVDEPVSEPASKKVSKVRIPANCIKQLNAGADPVRMIQDGWLTPAQYEEYQSRGSKGSKPKVKKEPNYYYMDVEGKPNVKVKVMGKPPGSKKPKKKKTYVVKMPVPPPADDDDSEVEIIMKKDKAGRPKEAKHRKKRTIEDVVLEEDYIKIPRPQKDKPPTKKELKRLKHLEELTKMEQATGKKIKTVKDFKMDERSVPKPRTPAQIAAFEKCRAKRAANLARDREEKEARLIGKAVPKAVQETVKELKKSKPAPPPPQKSREEVMQDYYLHALTGKQ